MFHQSRISYILLFFFLLPIAVSSRDTDPREVTHEDRKAQKVERSADKKFIQKDFHQAMEIYEKAFQLPLSNEYQAALHLKTARLYLNLLNYPAAIPHYEATMTLSEGLFNSMDVCNYLDALRYSNQRIRAMSIARKYTYQDVYHQDQRYQNILHALDYEDGFLSIGAPEYSVRAVKGASTANAEFWVGAKGDKYFYATSKSQFHDPNKRFYHRTSYHMLNEDGASSEKANKKDMLDMIPNSLQNGAVTFSEDMKRMVVTQISYEKGGAIGMSEEGLNTFQTKLYYSEYNTKRKGWSSFKEALNHKDGASYSHPFLFNNDRSILFSSDMPGGFGGYDIYVAHWDEESKQWANPINLGDQINTEGNEISPSMFFSKLIFSSDGHTGFGGYDIYSIDYEEDEVVEGSLFHFGYPINTVSNDFSMLSIDEDRGYLVSDRLVTNKDDIFYFERNQDSRRSKLKYGMSEATAISTGTINLAKLENSFNVPRKEVLPQKLYLEHVLSLYFDFEKFEIRKDALQELNTWFDDINLQRIENIILEGFADEMGTEYYNYNLSKKRAEAVAEWLIGKGVDINVETIGKGQNTVERQRRSIEVPLANEDTPSYRFSRSMNDRIKQNRKARRVDIKVVIK